MEESAETENRGDQAEETKTEGDESGSGTQNDESDREKPSFEGQTVFKGDFDEDDGE
ncbi:hypothetical protein [Halorussus lipolyticus]|uniref:hypothetical protein n=1 Tax=Halorussus lipolyticus TaxID=3034024 RepID=UPI0023E8C335|nr:hypothetical protein [Halorussus sp. DT80]